MTKCRLGHSAHPAFDAIPLLELPLSGPSAVNTLCGISKWIIGLNLMGRSLVGSCQGVGSVCPQFSRDGLLFFRQSGKAGQCLFASDLVQSLYRTSLAAANCTPGSDCATKISMPFRVWSTCHLIRDHVFKRRSVVCGPA